MLGLVDVWRALQPYQSTNRYFCVCPVDQKVPFNLAWLSIIGPDIGVSTNSVTVLASYYYLPDFYHSDPPQSDPQMRRGAEVTHPSQKLMVECMALSGNEGYDPYFGPDDLDVHPQGHGSGRLTGLFVDGRVALLKWAQWLYDPLLVPGSQPDWSSLSWTDFQ